MSEVNEARARALEVVKDYAYAEVVRSEGEVAMPEFPDVEAALVTLEAEIRANERARVREAIAESVEMLIDDSGDLGLGPSAYNNALRSAAKIARGEL